MSESADNSLADVPIIDLSKAPGVQETLRKSKLVQYAWQLVEILLVSNRLQISSRLRVAALRKFGATIGTGVVFRPRTRVKSPWNLEIGDRCWIGDGVWFHNRDRITLGHDVVLSQETYLTTGAHAMRTDMALITRPIVIESGAWITSRCVVLGGAHVGRSAVVSPLTVVRGHIPANSVVSAPEPTIVGTRFRTGEGA
ncbi:MAG: putative colanic acid biosynthesis acetyltransferase WcaF [Propionibacteriaceae bacterium]|jgi:putative colanic acid biosynthesis acetyltransferase WcaF|nr:acetyltransferase [Propionibacteriaceae bacterium]MDX6322069.1 putative colanic acid biosynthesis acetyltransferase WcaF [Propionibacteriaceae bacterium]